MRRVLIYRVTILSYTVILKGSSLMRILVYGAGVLGGNLAGNLFHAKKDVTVPSSRPGMKSYQKRLRIMPVTPIASSACAFSS